MISVNKKSMPLVNKLIKNKDEFKIEVNKLSQGSTVIDLGQNCRGSWNSAKILAEILFGGIGNVDYTTFPEKIGDVFYPAVDVKVDHSILSLAGCDISGWEISPGDFAPILAGPGRTLGRKDGDWLEKYCDYEDNYHEAVITIETKEPVKEKWAEKLRKACGVEAENLYILVAPSSSLACSVQVAARILEQTLHRMVDEGFNLESIIQAEGICVIPPCIDNELIAMGRLNDVLIYGGQSIFTVDWEDDKIEKVLNKITSDKSSVYGRPFKEIFNEAGRDFYQVPMEIYSPAKVVIVNTRSGKIHKAGKFNLEILEQSFSDIV